jgi:mRNA-degrading endonuclease RelE of RelBE toxin-antitoxin system
MAMPTREAPDPYKLIMSKTAADYFRKQVRSARLAETVMSFIQNELLRDPSDYKIPLAGALQGAYAARQKRFGIMYRINEEDRTIKIVRIYLRSRSSRTT